MKIEIFDLERIQSIWENRVKYNLTESGIHPYTLDELFAKEEIEKLHSVRLGYGQTNGSIKLRETIGKLYRNTNQDNVLVTTGSVESNFITSSSGDLRVHSGVRLSRSIFGRSSIGSLT